MIENGGVIRRRFNDQNLDAQERIIIALKSSNYRSNEKDALAWIILGLVAAVIGAAAAFREADWDMFFLYLQQGDGYEAFFGGENIIATGGIAAVIAIIVILEYWRRIHGRFGYVMLKDAIVRLRGRSGHRAL